MDGQFGDGQYSASEEGIVKRSSKHPSTAGFTLVETIVSSSIFFGLMASTCAMLLMGVTIRSRSVVSEFAETKCQRASREITYALNNAADWRIVDPSGTPTTEGNVLQVARNDGMSITFTYDPADGALAYRDETWPAGQTYVYARGLLPAPVSTDPAVRRPTVFFVADSGTGPAEISKSDEGLPKAQWSLLPTWLTTRRNSAGAVEALEEVRFTATGVPQSRR